jgi:single-strand DNA-binding protein
MSNDLNQCQFIGRLGNDPETKFLPTGGAVTNISIACGEKWKDKQTGQPQEWTEWVRVVAFGKLAEIMGEYLRKGSQVYISGSMRTRSWDKDGQKHYSTEIVADKMQMLGGKSDGQPSQQKQAQPAQQGYSQPASGFDDELPPF